MIIKAKVSRSQKFRISQGHFTSQSVQFSRSVVSDSLRPHESQHARPPCPSQTLGVYWNSWLSSRWCHPVISSSIVPFSSCPQSLLASGSFPVSQLLTSGGQSIGVSALPLVLAYWYQLTLYLGVLNFVLCCCSLITKSYLTLLRPHELWPTRLLYPWDFLGKNTVVGCLFLL